MKKTLTNILRNSLLAGSLTLGSIASDGCYKPVAKNYTNATSPTSQEYSEKENKEYVPTLEDFKRVLGKERLEEMTEEEIKRLERLWQSKDRYDIENREFLYDIYTRYKGMINDIKKDPEEYEKYQKYNPSTLEIEEYQKKCPWRLTSKDPKNSEADKLILYLLHKLHKESWKGTINIL